MLCQAVFEARVDVVEQEIRVGADEAVGDLLECEISREQVRELNLSDHARLDFDLELVELNVGLPVARILLGAQRDSRLGVFCGTKGRKSSLRSARDHSDVNTH